MKSSNTPVAVIDLFAGPGGLGEGFSKFQANGKQKFKSVLSIEKEASAHQTLQLRSFYRHFPEGHVPDEYFQLLRGEIGLQTLYEAHPTQAQAAMFEAQCIELGAEQVDTVRKKIGRALGNTDTCVLLGGPPCQPFSLAGRSRNRKGTQYSDGQETRHQLYIEYLQIIADFWPKVFVMENVRGLLSAKFDGKMMFNAIAEDLQDPTAALRRSGRGRQRTSEKYKYRLYPISPRSGNGGNGLFQDHEDLHDFLVRSEEHGVPQARHRLILIGVREDIKLKPAHLVKEQPVPAERVLEGLPELRSGLSRDDSHEAWQANLRASLSAKWFKHLEDSDVRVSRIIKTNIQSMPSFMKDRGACFLQGDFTSLHEPEWYRADSRLGGVCNHQARGHMAKDLHRYLFAACHAIIHKRSPNLRDFPMDLLPEHASVETGHFADRFRVQVGSRPSTTVVSHIAKDGHYYIHPDPKQCRSLTVREAARLQTFPDDYFFMGNRTQQYTQVGNAVPPLLAHKIAGIVWDLLHRSGNA